MLGCHLATAPERVSYLLLSHHNSKRLARRVKYAAFIPRENFHRDNEHDRDIALWLHPETGQPRNTNYTRCEPLKLWIDTLRQRIIDHRYDHQPGRPRLKSAPTHPA